MKKRKYKLYARLPGSPIYDLVRESSNFKLLSKFFLECEYFSEKMDTKVCDYTGLKDKNGVEVYEGDVLELETGHMVGVVSFRAGSFILDGYACGCGFIEQMSDHAEIDSLDWVVIGNVHENPELLEGNE